MRRRAGREDIKPIDNWLPNPFYTHLVLQDYLASRFPEKVMVCPRDKARRAWQRDPVNYHNLGVAVPADAGSNAGKRWPYSSSYQFVPASYDRFQSVLDPGVGNRRLRQGDGHRRFVIPVSAGLGGLRFSGVHFPGDKVFLHDSHGRHSGRPHLYFGDDESRQPLAFFDGSVRVYRSKLTNKGWQPDHQEVDRPTEFRYRPAEWEAPLRDGSYPAPVEDGDQVTGYYRWTRGGLKGMDVGGAEIDTGQR